MYSWEHVLEDFEQNLIQEMEKAYVKLTVYDDKRKSKYMALEDCKLRVYMHWEI